MAIGYNPRIVTDGLVLALDAANIKSYSAKNLFENPTDILSWMGSTPSASNATLSRDTTVSSPVGNSPMKMVCSAGDAYTQTWGNSASSYLISSASQGETFTVSVWAKSASGTTLADCQIFIFDANSSGSWDGSSFSSGTFTVTDTWQRFSFTRTTTWSSTANIQVRFDGPQNGTGTLWWDGMQVERSSTATDFSYNGPSTVLDMSNKGNSGSISNLTHTSGVDGYFDFNGTNGYIRPSNSSDFSFGTGDFAVEFWAYYKGSGSKFTVDTRTTLSGAGFDFGFSTNAKIWDTSFNDWLYNGSTTYDNDTWHHVVFTRSGTTISVYVDGSLDGTVTSSRNLTETGCYIGANVNISYGSGSYSNARASNVRIYKGKSLSSAEVQQNYNAHKRRYYTDIEVIDLRESMVTVATAIQNGRTGYLLTTNNYSYRFDANDARYVIDGIGDMFDNANFTTPISSSTRSNTSPSVVGSASYHPYSIYYDQTTPLSHPNLSSYTYVAGGWTYNNYAGNDGPLIVAATTGNSGYQWCGWMTGGDSGADGNGSRSQTDIYNGVIVNGFKVYSSYMSTTGTTDPSHNDLHILLGHPKWGSVFGTINKYNNTSSAYVNSAMWSESTSQNNILAIKLLIARSSGVAPVQSEMQGIVDDIIGDIKTEFGY